MVPAGALQGVLYNKDRPQYLNYGSIGSTMGHQTYHTVFDEKSCRSEAKYYDWLSTTTLLEFNNKLSCVAMHYGKYYVPEIQEHVSYFLEYFHLINFYCFDSLIRPTLRTKILRTLQGCNWLTTLIILGFKIMEKNQNCQVLITPLNNYFG